MVRLAPLLVGGAAGLAQQTGRTQVLMQNSEMSKILKEVSEKCLQPKCDHDDKTPCEETKPKEMIACIVQNIVPEEAKNKMGDEEKAKIDKGLKEVQESVEQLDTTMKDVGEKCQHQESKCNDVDDKTLCVEAAKSACVKENILKAMPEEMRKPVQEFSAVMEKSEEMLKRMQEFSAAMEKSEDMSAAMKELFTKMEMPKGMLEALQEFFTKMEKSEDMPAAMKDLLTKMEKSEDMPAAMKDLHTKMGDPKEMIEAVQKLSSEMTSGNVDQQQSGNITPNPSQVEQAMTNNQGTTVI